MPTGVLGAYWCAKEGLLVCVLTAAELVCVLIVGRLRCQKELRLNDFTNKCCQREPIAQSQSGNTQQQQPLAQRTPSSTAQHCTAQHSTAQHSPHSWHSHSHSITTLNSDTGLLSHSSLAFISNLRSVVLTTRVIAMSSLCTLAGRTLSHCITALHCHTASLHCHTASLSSLHCCAPE